MKSTKRRTKRKSQSSEMRVVGFASREYIAKVSALALSMETPKEQLFRSMLGYLPV